MSSRSRGFRRILRRILGIVLVLLLITALYIIVILAQPHSDKDDSTYQPLLTASPAASMQSGTSVETLISDFPGLVMCATPSSGWTAIAGSSRDVAFENGCGRILTLVYQLPDNREVRITSVYPARAASLLPTEGYRLTGEGPRVAGGTTVRMEQGNSLRLYTKSTSGLFMVELTGTDEDSLDELLRPVTVTGWR